MLRLRWLEAARKGVVRVARAASGERVRRRECKKLHVIVVIISIRIKVLICGHGGASAARAPEVLPGAVGGCGWVAWRHEVISLDSSMATKRALIHVPGLWFIPVLL